MQMGKQRKKVSARRFRQMFAKLWNEEVGGNREAILEAYQDNTNWTEYMLATNQTPCEDTFLGRLSERMELAMVREQLRLDAIFHSQDQDNVLRINPSVKFPACMNVIIEHENGEYVEREMWKLLMIRSPLKVLMFYDYREDEKTTDERKRTWLKKKLEKLLEWCRHVDSVWPESRNAEYLFLVGNRTTAEAMPVWRFAIVKPRRLFRKWRISKLKTLC